MTQNTLIACPGGSRPVRESVAPPICPACLLVWKLHPCTSIPEPLPVVSPTVRDTQDTSPAAPDPFSPDPVAVRALLPLCPLRQAPHFGMLGSHPPKRDPFILRQDHSLKLDAHGANAITLPPSTDGAGRSRPTAHLPISPLTSSHKPKGVRFRKLPPNRLGRGAPLPRARPKPHHRRRRGIGSEGTRA
jgi:hypothetical protein